MEYGAWSLLPPIVTIVLAFTTKRVVIALVSGILCGTLILADGYSRAFYMAIVATVLAFPTKRVMIALVSGILCGTLIFSGGYSRAFYMAIDIFWEKTEFAKLRSWSTFNHEFTWNIYIILFCCILGIIIGLLNRAGGAIAYGKWAVTKIKSRVGASLATIFMGIVIFFDDYFNCLTVGSVMRPVTDKFKISRAKLAYLIDSTAAPVCILVPVSSWGIEVITLMKVAGVAGDPWQIFLHSIAFNSYAWFALVMVGFVCISQRDFGPMKNHEDKARLTGNLFNGGDEVVYQDNDGVNENGKIVDLILPLIVLIGLVIILWRYTDHMGKAMFWGGSCTLILLVNYLVFVRSTKITEVFQTALRTLKTMLPVVMTLILAWTMSSVIAKVDTGGFIAHFITDDFVPLLPAFVFLMSCTIAFATGTSWGTFAIMIPIVAGIVPQNNTEFLIPMIAAVLAGAIYGDHTSPISDTTILSSIGAGCKHIDHVVTQAPYSGVIAIISLVGFIINGFTIHFGKMFSATCSLVTGGVLICILFFLLKVFDKESKNGKNLDTVNYAVAKSTGLQNTI